MRRQIGTATHFGRLTTAAVAAVTIILIAVAAEAQGRGQGASGRGCDLPEPFPCPFARILELTVEPATINPGESARITWAAENPSGMTLTPGVGRALARGTVRVTPSATTTYTLLSQGGPGGQPVTRSVTVVVRGTQPVNTTEEALWAEADSADARRQAGPPGGLFRRRFRGWIYRWRRDRSGNDRASRSGWLAEPADAEVRGRGPAASADARRHRRRLLCRIGPGVFRSRLPLPDRADPADDRAARRADALASHYPNECGALRGCVEWGAPVTSWLLSGALGKRHARRRYARLQRQGLCRHQQWLVYGRLHTLAEAAHDRAHSADRLRHD